MSKSKESRLDAVVVVVLVVGSAEKMEWVKIARLPSRHSLENVSDDPDPGLGLKRKLLPG